MCVCAVRSSGAHPRQPPHRIQIQPPLAVPADRIVACGRDVFVLTCQALYRLVAHTAADGWTRYHLTQCVSWINSRPSSTSLRAIDTEAHGVVCASLTYSVLTLYFSRTNQAVRMPYSPEAPFQSIALSASALFHQSETKFRRFPFDLAPPMVTDAPLPPTNYPSGDLRLLPDGSVLFILLSWREEGLLVHRVDHTGRTVLDYTYHKCAADVKYNPRAIAVCGNDYLVCAMEARAPRWPSRPASQRSLAAPPRQPPRARSERGLRNFDNL